MKDTNGGPGRVQSPRRITSLPGEAISRILIHIDHSDIPALMLTCKILCSAIMTRQFWYHRIHRLCKEHLVSPPEEELEEYTVAELEKWTLRRIWARCNLPTKLHLRSRNVDMSLETSSLLLLIPGGRWLLVFRFDGFVYSFDLDSNYSNRYTLFDPSQMGPCTRNFGIMYPRKYVWIDHKAPRLSFRFAVVFHLKEDGLYFSWVYICHVNLVGHGTSATLVTQIIATFRGPNELGISYLSGFNNRFLVALRPSLQGDTVNILVFDYSQALGCLDHPPLNTHTFPLEDGLWCFELLVDNILLLFCQWSIFYCNIESPTSIKRLRTSRINWPQYTIEYSRTCWTPEALIITLARRARHGRRNRTATLYGLVVPHDSELDPWMVDLGDVRTVDVNFKVGILISLSCGRTGRFKRVGHQWDFTSESSNQKRCWYLYQEADQPESLLLFDEDTGRSVHSRRDMMNIVDMVIADGR